jgi:hypothetical protein
MGTGIHSRRIVRTNSREWLGRASPVKREFLRPSLYSGRADGPGLPHVATRTHT